MEDRIRRNRQSPVTHANHEDTLNNVRSVSSARRSGQEDFQRGTPPVSLASCSISPSLDLVLTRSDPQRTTRQIARGHQS